MEDLIFDLTDVLQISSVCCQSIAKDSLVCDQSIFRNKERYLRVFDPFCKRNVLFLQERILQRDVISAIGKNDQGFKVFCAVLPHSDEIRAVLLLDDALDVGFKVVLVLACETDNGIEVCLDDDRLGMRLKRIDRIFRHLFAKLVEIRVFAKQSEPILICVAV